jgi:dimethylargininase
MTNVKRQTSNPKSQQSNLRSHTSNAIVREPGGNFADGITTVELGRPDYDRAIEQHRAYCAALRQCGLTLTQLGPDEQYPDSTFVEDTAIVTDRGAIITRPGAATRAGEVDQIANVLSHFYPELQIIKSRGTLDAGDVCETGNHFLIGISERTNEEGANQLADFLASFGHTASFVDIRGLNDILHLKSGLAYLGDNRLAVIESLANVEAIQRYELVRVPPGEEYAANCIRINDHVLIAAGHNRLERALKDIGYDTIALEMSEFQKMDGGLSCLSLRFRRIEFKL